MALTRDAFIARRYKTRSITVASLEGDVVMRSPSMSDFAAITPVFAKMDREGDSKNIFDVFGEQEQAHIRAVLAKCIIEPKLEADDLAECDMETFMALFGALSEMVNPSSEAESAKASDAAGEAKN